MNTLQPNIASYERLTLRRGRVMSLYCRRLLYLAMTVMASTIGFLHLSSGPAYASEPKNGNASFVSGFFVCDCTVSNAGSCLCITQGVSLDRQGGVQ